MGDFIGVDVFDILIGGAPMVDLASGYVLLYQLGASGTVFCSSSSTLSTPETSSSRPFASYRASSPSSMGDTWATMRI